MNFYRLFPALTLSLILTACGGGGGGGGGGGSTATVASTSTFQIKTAYVNDFTTASSVPFTASGTTSGTPFTGSGTATTGAPSTTTFEGQSALQTTSVITGSLLVKGTTAPLSSTSTSYYDSNYAFLGSNGTDYVVVNSAFNLPNTAKVGDTGVVFTANRYSNSSKSLLTGMKTVSFAIEADTASTALLKVVTVDKDTSNATTYSSTATIRITPSGGSTRVNEQGIDYTNHTTLTITY